MLAALVASSAAMRPVVVGLTGGIGMGKSSAASWFRRCGFRVHDSDACVHALYAPGGAAVAPVVEAFPGSLAADGGIDRAALSAAVAAKGREEALRTLECIVHPLVTASRSEFVRQAQEDGEWLVVVDVPLLLETNKNDADLRKQVDLVLVVSAGEEEQRKRVLRRPGMTPEKLDSILARQLPDAMKRARADLVLETGLGDGYAETRAQLAAFLETSVRKFPEHWAKWLARRATCDAASDLDNSSKVAQGDDIYETKGTGYVRCVSFDLDETCWPTKPPIVQAQQVLSSRMAVAMPKAYAAGAISQMGALFAEIRTEKPLVAHDLTEQRRLALLRLAAMHGDTISSEDAAGIVDEFVTSRSQTGAYLFPDVSACIGSLRAAGLVVGAVTDGNAHVSRDQVVAPLFDFSICAEEAGATKEGLAPHLMAAAEAGCHPSQVVHIGDSISKDLIGALRCGCRVVLLSRPTAPPRPVTEEALRPPIDPSLWVEVSDLKEAAKAVVGWADTPPPVAK